MAIRHTGVLLVVFLLAGSEVKAAHQRIQQVPAPSPNPLDGFELPEVELPPAMATINLTQIAPILPLLAGLNLTVVASWVPVVERTPSESMALVVPALNAINASTLEAVLAALPYLNWDTVLAILPAVNAIPAPTLTAYVKLLSDIDPKLVEALLPSIAVLDPTWVNKVVPAVVRAFDADYLVRLVRTIAPGLSKVNPDLLVALLPMVNTISLETWQKLIELLNKITIQQLELLLHLLDVTGPALDKMVTILNTMRRALPVDATTYMGKTSIFTKPKGTIGLQPSSIIFGRKIHPTATPNNGAPPAPLPPPAPMTPFPRTLNSTNSTDSNGRRLLSFFHWW